jgi:DegV family protein with EDD domain
MKTISLEILKAMFLRSFERIEAEKEEINKINVFPVPDQDTGTNLAKTLEGIKKAIEGKNFQSKKEMADVILEGALNSAQGNVGVIFTGFLVGFFSNLNEENVLDVKNLAILFEKGKEKAFKSILNPKEGTILDVISAFSQSFFDLAQKKEEIEEIFEISLEKAKLALIETKEKMEILKKANVVDAGGLGFLMILESFFEVLKGEKRKIEKMPSGEIKRMVQIMRHRFEIVALIENPKLKEEEVKEKLKDLGDSLDLILVQNKLKLHIHTDWPEEVKKIIRNFGEIIELKEEDMAKEIAKEPSVKKVSVGIVTDNVASILPKILERYQIEIAEAKFDWPELEKIEGENIYQKIKKAYEIGIETRPRTSQAMPKDYLEAFKKQLERFDKVLCLTLTSKLSGCYNSAIQAKEMLSEKDRERIFVFDTFNGMAGQALFVLRAIELIQEQREIEEILEELEKLIPKIHTYLIIQDPKGMELIGRITKNQANWIRRMKKLGIHPIIKIKDGILTKGGVVFAKDEPEALFKKILKESEKERKLDKKIRAIINHADNIEGAKKLKGLLKEKGIEVSFISEASPILCAVTGPGTLICSWQPIE